MVNVVAPSPASPERWPFPLAELPAPHISTVPLVLGAVQSNIHDTDPSEKLLPPAAWVISRAGSPWSCVPWSAMVLSTPSCTATLNPPSTAGPPVIVAVYVFRSPGPTDVGPSMVITAPDTSPWQPKQIAEPSAPVTFPLLRKFGPWIRAFVPVGSSAAHAAARAVARRTEKSRLAFMGLLRYELMIQEREQPPGRERFDAANCPCAMLVARTHVTRGA